MLDTYFADMPPAARLRTTVALTEPRGGNLLRVFLIDRQMTRPTTRDRQAGNKRKSEQSACIRAPRLGGYATGEQGGKNVRCLEEMQSLLLGELCRAIRGSSAEERSLRLAELPDGERQ